MLYWLKLKHIQKPADQVASIDGHVAEKNYSNRFATSLDSPNPTLETAVRENQQTENNKLLARQQQKAKGAMLI